MIGIIYYSPWDGVLLYVVDKDSIIHRLATKYNDHYLGSDYVENEFEFIEFIDTLRHLKPQPFPYSEPLEHIFMIGGATC